MDEAPADGGTGGTGGSLLGNQSGGTPPASAGGTGAEGTPAPAGTAQAGNETPWIDSLPTELKDDATLKTFKDVKSLAAAHVALKKHLGADKIALPGKHATPEDWKAVFTKLGVPEKLEDYKAEFKKDAVITDEFANDFRTKLHSLGVLPSQAQALADRVS